MLIYTIVNSESLKLYVGQHKGQNLRKYMQTKISDATHQVHLRSHLYAAMRQYPKDTWSIHPLLEVQTKAELDEWERLLIYALKTQHPDIGYNICDGGEGFTGPHSGTAKQRMRLASLGNQNCLGQVQSPETIAKRIAKTRGQTRTSEQRARMSAGRAGKGMGDRNYQHVYGLSEMAKVKIGEKNKAGWTPERRKTWSEYKSLHNGMKGKTPWNKAA